MVSVEPYRVLIVEDDPTHVVLIQIVFAQLDANARINVTRSAEEAIAFFEGLWPDKDYGKARAPDVIIIDIGMPGIGGVGFLEWYATQPDLGSIPVVVFTSSSSPQLAARCFALGAREFKEKPTDFSELVPVVQRVLDHWEPGNAASSGS